MRKVLIVAEYFPPAGAVGTFRVTKFAKYLREFGWEPVVLTLQQECYAETNWPIDHSLVKDIPAGMSLYRTPLWKSTLFNDPGVRWLPPLFFRISSVIREECPTLLYVTGNPFIPLIVAPVVKFFYGLNYIVDLRDPWKLALPIQTIRGVKTRCIRALNNILEPLVIKHASKIICVSDQMCEEYRKEYSQLSPNNFSVITNGYDPSDFESIPPIKFPQFTIVYTGKFHTGESFRDPTCFFHALKELERRDIKVRFIHVGEKDPEVIRIAVNSGVAESCTFVGQCPYREAIGYAKGADLLLLIGGGQKTEQTGKIFDYLGCNRPILALAKKDSGIGDVVISTSSAIMVKNNDSSSIAKAIETHYLTGFSGDIKAGDFLKYHRRVLTSELARILDQVAGALAIH